MKKFFNVLNVKKSIALLLVLTSLFLVSCDSKDASTSAVSDVISEESSLSESVGASSETGSVDDESSSENSEASAEKEPSSTESAVVSEEASEEASNDNSSVESVEASSAEPTDSSEEVSEEASEATSEEASEETSETPAPAGVGDKVASAANLDKIPEYSGTDYIFINNGTPYFSASQLTVNGYEKYGDLDSLGRCTAAIASLGEETMPTGDRGSISSVKPTGWIQAKYSCIKTSDLYNRSHLIAWALAGEDANKQNLVTGTAHLNQTVMTQFEDMVLDYLRETGNHVAYRVTPLFKGNELVCRGVQMEAYSIEDNGEGICFNVYCYNVQPGVIIDYATGASEAEGGEESSEAGGNNSTDNGGEESSGTENIEADYVLNKKSKKIHYPDCKSVSDMSEKNKEYYTGNIEDLYAQGYTGCGNCMS